MSKRMIELLFHCLADGRQAKPRIPGLNIEPDHRRPGKAAVSKKKPDERGSTKGPASVSSGGRNSNNHDYKNKSVVRNFIAQILVVRK